ncbi:substrate-binding and VWA domain-containing protein [Actinomadura xylanilytica]|uniref:substrate-binding and VWA domain-containing protein n=1 Tax=Actinomadura xylanilytica TaxID=887459 RepID=UPI00255A78F4|nr:substrate-binding and VWA domain-containing protein [Actinomadura xylanilytica]MDL4772202.1 substrate-binding and VWA domain-containing protein [Actinomadura xylanilytica]
MPGGAPPSGAVKRQKRPKERKPKNRPKSVEVSGWLIKVPTWASMPLLVGTVAALLLAAGAFIGVSTLGGGCGSRMRLSIAADSGVAPALTELSRRFNEDDGNKVDGKCVEVTVNAAPSPSIAMAIGGDGPAVRLAADVYVPDSSLWLEPAARAAERNRIAVPKPAGSVATSPVVLVRPKNAASAGAALSWRSLQPGPGGSPYALRIVDPERDATGLAALIKVREAAGGGERSASGFASILDGGKDAVAPDVASGFAALAQAGNRTPVLAASEQALWKQARAGGAPITPVIPADGTMSLDYPLIVPAPGKAEAAGAFLRAIGTERGAAELAKVGLRAAGKPPARTVSAVTGVAPQVSGPSGATPGLAVQSLEMWRRMRLGTRMLTVIDVSGSMLEQVPGTGRTRMQITAGEVEHGMAMLSDGTEIGVWSFSTGMDGPRPYRELAPIAPLGQTTDGGTHRASVGQALGRIRAKPDGDTGLYDTVLAAYRKVKSGYRDDMINIALVLTDGRNDFAGGIDEQTLLAGLKREYDPSRPVQVVGLAFGPDVDMAALERIARSTGGAAYRINKPMEIRTLFQRSAAFKMCDDPANCPAAE